MMGIWRIGLLLLPWLHKMLLDDPLPVLQTLKGGAEPKLLAFSTALSITLGVFPVCVLSWDVRYRIALGTAQGLSYLHSDCTPPIVHRDIKPKNILLDDEMELHISDFGIASRINLSAATVGHHSSAIIGTFGYLPPECTISTGKNKASDVYGYGVVLLELLTRKQAMDPSFEQNMNLVSLVSSILQENYSITGTADQGLLDEFSKHPSALEEARKVLYVATKCTAKVVLQRPSMKDVVNTLTDVKNDR